LSTRLVMEGGKILVTFWYSVVHVELLSLVPDTYRTLKANIRRSIKC
jgi:hypothetical protein